MTFAGSPQGREEKVTTQRGSSLQAWQGKCQRGCVEWSRRGVKEELREQTQLGVKSMCMGVMCMWV